MNGEDGKGKQDDRGGKMTKEGIEQLKSHEGLMLRAYRCPAGRLTIGYGHTGDIALSMDTVITTKEADRLLESDVREAEIGARALLENFPELTPRRQDAVVNLVFNLARSGLSKFKTFLRAMRAGEWHAAASALEMSHWYHQVGHRSRDIVKMILEG